MTPEQTTTIQSKLDFLRQQVKAARRRGDDLTAEAYLGEIAGIKFTLTTLGLAKEGEL